MTLSVDKIDGCDLSNIAHHEHLQKRQSTYHRRSPVHYPAVATRQSTLVISSVEKHVVTYLKRLCFSLVVILLT